MMTRGVFRIPYLHNHFYTIFLQSDIIIVSIAFHINCTTLHLNMSYTILALILCILFTLFSFLVWLLNKPNIFLNRGERQSLLVSWLFIINDVLTTVTVNSSDGGPSQSGRVHAGWTLCSAVLIYSSPYFPLLHSSFSHYWRQIVAPCYCYTHHYVV